MQLVNECLLILASVVLERIGALQSVSTHRQQGAVEASASTDLAIIASVELGYVVFQLVPDVNCYARMLVHRCPPPASTGNRRGHFWGEIDFSTGKL